MRQKVTKAHYFPKHSRDSVKELKQIDNVLGYKNASYALEETNPDHELIELKTEKQRADEIVKDVKKSRDDLVRRMTDLDAALQRERSNSSLVSQLVEARSRIAALELCTENREQELTILKNN